MSTPQTPATGSDLSEYLSPIQLGIALLQGILAQYKAAGATQSVLDGIQAAITELLNAHGQAVTLSELESLRVPIPAWSAPTTGQ